MGCGSGIAAGQCTDKLPSGQALTQVGRGSGSSDGGFGSVFVVADGTGA